MHYMYGGQCVVPGARLAEVSSEHYMYNNNTHMYIYMFSQKGTCK